jgi:hypothetical protein
MASARKCIPFLVPEPPITQVDIVELLLARQLVTPRENALRERLLKGATVEEGLHWVRLAGDSVIAE